MSAHMETGRWGEELAQEFLKKKGYAILDINWRFPPYEIDIIAQLNDLVVFVEVKTRKDSSHGFPEQAVTRKKANALLKAAEIYLEEKGIENEIRFDIVSILLNTAPPDIFHIEDGINPYPFA